jgi:pyridoxine 5-phosphate synthase
MTKLGVNIDHVATIRQARRAGFPDIVEAAGACERAGAAGITVHLREDRRHIQDSDVVLLRNSLKTKLNLEMSAAPEIVKFALKIIPDAVCIVPEKRLELTTEGGLDVSGQMENLRRVARSLREKGIQVSLFIDPEEKQIKASKAIGADCVELHTGKYADNFENAEVRDKELRRLRDSAEMALGLGLVLNAGHGLDYKNVKPVAEIKGMNELNIGFSIIARAVFVGLEAAVKEMKELISCAG